jgi:phosphonate transport system ATP-binding protein
LYDEEASVIHVRSVSHTFPNGTQALKNITLELLSDRFIAMIGASGAGKSTLLRVLNGLIKPSSGEVLVSHGADYGLELTRARPSQVLSHRRNIGMVFQQFNLVRRLTALENVLSGRLGYVSPWRSTLSAYSQQDKELAMNMLERVGMADYAWQRADTLSGGQQQRVGIARALAQQPKMILADEPISALDPKSSDQVMNLLRDIHERDGIAVIANLHFLDTVRDYAGRVIALKAGQLVFDGTVSDLTESVTNEIYYGTEEPLPPTEIPAYADFKLQASLGGPS